MWFNFFKRSPPPAVPKPKPKAKAKRRPTQSSYADLPTEPSALPEVTEGSEHGDWQLWENSVAAINSQVQPLSTSVSRFRDELDEPSQFQEVEAYAKVKKKDP
jgi:hypothetical protein